MRKVPKAPGFNCTLAEAAFAFHRLYGTKISPTQFHKDANKMLAEHGADKIREVLKGFDRPTYVAGGYPELNF